MTNLYLWEQFTNNENTASTDLELLVWVRKDFLDTFELWLIENSPLHSIKNGVVVKLDEWTMAEDEWTTTEDEWTTTEDSYIKDEEHY